MHKYKHSKPKLHSILLLSVLFLFTLHLAGQSISPLKSGKWLKISVTQSGFYQINQAWLRKHNIENINPDKICIYAGNTGMLSPDKSYEEGLLKPIPTYYHTNTKGPWNILFWGDSPHMIHQDETWQQEINLYSDSTFYFIQLDAGKTNPIKEIENSISNVPHLSFAWSLKHYEPETYNLIQSGQTWLGDAFYGNSSKILQYSLSDYMAGQAAYLKIKLYAASISPSTFSIPALDKTLHMPPILGGRYDQKATGNEIRVWTKPALSNNTWNWPINYQSTSGTGYIDFISLMYPKGFDGKNENPLYLLPNTSDSLLRIDIPNLRASQQIWINNGGLTWQKLAKNAEFTYKFRPNSQLAIADLEKANEPAFCGLIKNQDTFEVPAETELIIISSPVLETAASKLATYKNVQRKIKSKNISTQAIYHDFSGGKQDVTALRNFIRYQYQKPGSKLKYIILLGDASIDFKGQNPVSSALEKSCFVPTYQSEESFQPLMSYASDDYYGNVSHQEGPWNETGPLSIAIGRIPAKNPQEANMFINKLADFESKPNTSIPRFAWVADDGDSNIHMQDAEDFSTMLQKALLPVRQEKVYVDQYPMQQENGVYTSTAAKQAVLKLFDENADFIHFMGHGSESGWTDEKILTTNELVNLKNSNHLPILLTATCQFGRFDDPNMLSGGEVSLMSDQGGAIALISTTRPVFQSSNYLFGQAFYQAMLQNKDNQNYRLGDLFRDAKNKSQLGDINRNIQLIGDPTLELPWTRKNLQVTLDSSKQEIRLSGLPAQGGKVQLSLLRTSDPAKTLGTKNMAFQYTKMSPILWRSAGFSTNNVMTISLKTMPNLTAGQKYQLQAWTNDIAQKYAFGLDLASWKNKQRVEKNPPTLNIDLPHEDLKATSPNPWATISIADSSGLLWQNASGNMASLMVDDSIRIELASKYIPALANPTYGEIQIQLKSLTPGLHKIQAFCWDIYNNYGEATLSFQVKGDETADLQGYVYPNPLARTFHYVFKQEKPWNLMPYEIKLYDILGRLITTKKGLSNYYSDNKSMIEFEWQEDEYEQLNSSLILEIQLWASLTNEIKTHRIKTSTLK